MHTFFINRLDKLRPTQKFQLNYNFTSASAYITKSSKKCKSYHHSTMKNKPVVYLTQVLPAHTLKQKEFSSKAPHRYTHKNFKTYHLGCFL